MMQPTRVVIHCSATANGEPCDIDTIRQWHVTRGFSDVGYHLVIQPDGEVQRGRPLNAPGAHCIEANGDSVGICLIGLDRFTHSQFRTLRYQLESLAMTYDIKPWQIFGHYEFRSAQRQRKTCPNILIQSILGWYLTGREDAIKQYLTT